MSLESEDTVPLGMLAQITGAATVAEAYEMASALADLPLELDTRGLAFRVVNTGTIGRYHHGWGVKPLRYLGKSYLRPVMPEELLRARWPRRAEQSQAPKVIVAGLAKSLRACWDRSGEILAAKSTVVVQSSLVDLRLIVAVLNSRWMSDWYRARYSGLTLQGGYLQYTPSHLKTLPFPTTERCQSLRPLVERLQSLVERIAADRNPVVFRTLDDEIELLVRELVGQE